jgi:predicted Zn-dependent peptidase
LYKPENTIFVVTGNFSPEPIYKIVEKTLGPLENSSDSAITYFNEKPIIFKNIGEQKEPYVYIKKNTHYQQVYVIFAFPIYDLYSYQSNEIDLLTQLLSAGFSSRLNKALRENKGITYVSTAYPIVYSDCGLFLVEMVLNPSELIKGLKIVLKELKKIKNEPMTSQEMIKIINVTKNETIYTLVKPIDMLTYFGINFLLSRDFKPNIEKDFNDLKKVTRSQVQKVAKEIFVWEKINLFMYGNIEETDFNFLNL